MIQSEGSVPSLTWMVWRTLSTTPWQMSTMKASLSGRLDDLLLYGQDPACQSFVQNLRTCWDPRAADGTPPGCTSPPPQSRDRCGRRPSGASWFLVFVFCSFLLFLPAKQSSLP
jgi:hypothetical protein